MPEPVGASASRSLFSRPIGIAYIWMGVGRLYANPYRVEASESKGCQDLSGGGTSPLTMMLWFSRKMRQSRAVISPVLRTTTATC